MDPTTLSIALSDALKRNEELAERIVALTKENEALGNRLQKYEVQEEEEAVLGEIPEDEHELELILDRSEYESLPGKWRSNKRVIEKLIAMGNAALDKGIADFLPWKYLSFAAKQYREVVKASLEVPKEPDVDYKYTNKGLRAIQAWSEVPSQFENDIDLIVCSVAKGKSTWADHPSIENCQEELTQACKLRLEMGDMEWTKVPEMFKNGTFASSLNLETPHHYHWAVLEASRSLWENRDLWARLAGLSPVRKETARNRTTMSTIRSLLRLYPAMARDGEVMKLLCRAYPNLVYSVDSACWEYAPFTTTIISENTQALRVVPVHVQRKVVPLIVEVHFGLLKRQGHTDQFFLEQHLHAFLFEDRRNAVSYFGHGLPFVAGVHKRFNNDKEIMLLCIQHGNWYDLVKKHLSIDLLRDPSFLWKALEYTSPSGTGDLATLHHERIARDPVYCVTSTSSDVFDLFIWRVASSTSLTREVMSEKMEENPHFKDIALTEIHSRLFLRDFVYHIVFHGSLNQGRETNQVIHSLVVDFIGLHPRKVLLQALDNVEGA